MASSQETRQSVPEKDIQLPDLSALSWKTSQDIETSLQKLYEFADGSGQKTHQWYLRAKRPKQIGSRWLRLSAIFLGTVGGLMPIIISIVGGVGRFAWLAQAGYLALGLAAGCVVLDKFFGFSSGWTRYMTAAQELEALTSRFRFDWNIRRLALSASELTPETATPLIEFVRDYVSAVQTSVQQETRLWIAEFQAGLAVVDQLAKARGQELPAPRLAESLPATPVAEHGPSVANSTGTGGGMANASGAM